MNWAKNFIFCTFTDEDYVYEYDLEYDNDFNSTAKGILVLLVSFFLSKLGWSKRFLIKKILSF